MRDENLGHWNQHLCSHSPLSGVNHYLLRVTVKNCLILQVCKDKWESQKAAENYSPCEMIDQTFVHLRWIALFRVIGCTGLHCSQLPLKVSVAPHSHLHQLLSGSLYHWLLRPKLIRFPNRLLGVLRQCQQCCIEFLVISCKISKPR